MFSWIKGRKVSNFLWGTWLFLRSWHINDRPSHPWGLAPWPTCSGTTLTFRGATKPAAHQVVLVKVMKKETLGHDSGWLGFSLSQEKTVYSKITLDMGGGGTKKTGPRMINQLKYGYFYNDKRFLTWNLQHKTVALNPLCGVSACICFGSVYSSESPCRWSRVP